MEYTGLTTHATAAHIHGPADPGQNATSWCSFPAICGRPIKGSATLTDAQAADLQAGKYYVHPHGGQ